MLVWLRRRLGSSLSFHDQFHLLPVLASSPAHSLKCPYSTLLIPSATPAPASLGLRNLPSTGLDPVPGGQCKSLQQPNPGGTNMLHGMLETPGSWCKSIEPAQSWLGLCSIQKCVNQEIDVFHLFFFLLSSFPSLLLSFHRLLNTVVTAQSLFKNKLQENNPFGCLYKMIHGHKALCNFVMISGTLWSDCSLLPISED